MSELDPVAPAGAEVLGIDEAAAWDAHRKALIAHIKTDEAKAAAAKHQEEQEQRAQAKDTLFFHVVHRTLNGREFWRAECIAGLPDDRMSISLVLEQRHWLSSEAKHALAQQLFRTRVCGSWEAAQRRAAEANIIEADR